MSRRLTWAAMAAVVLVALAVGAERGGPPTADERVRQIGSEIRCPTCRGLSVADSDAPVAQAIRTEIRRRIDEGRESDDQIREFVLSRYPDSSLRPEASGLGLVVWLLPAVVVAGAAGGMLAVMIRRRRRSVGATEDDRRLVEQAMASGGDAE